MCNKISQAIMCAKNYIDCNWNHLAKMIPSSSGEERNDLADDTNDAVDDIVAGLITADPIFGASNQSILASNHQTNLDPVSSPLQKRNTPKQKYFISLLLP